MFRWKFRWKGHEAKISIHASVYKRTRSAMNEWENFHPRKCLQENNEREVWRRDANMKIWMNISFRDSGELNKSAFARFSKGETAKNRAVIFAGLLPIFFLKTTKNLVKCDRNSLHSLFLHMNRAVTFAGQLLENRTKNLVKYVRSFIHWHLGSLSRMH